MWSLAFVTEVMPSQHVPVEGGGWGLWIVFGAIMIPLTVMAVLGHWANKKANDGHLPRLSRKPDIREL